ncbi:hypothetical protein TPA0910_43110 [Streptomyces hygroscopicus subsp. sporocinereus]|uniref:Uncharacterized protein n=1 Tax=Streptomyces hygroscopicus TaxID=1912 RepID=A0ABQ3U2R7_STRHY|nr:hypothetical protein TPA0910_43110 [Streptomyces hygroscopicus]
MGPIEARGVGPIDARGVGPINTPCARSNDACRARAVNTRGPSDPPAVGSFFLIRVMRGGNASWSLGRATDRRAAMSRRLGPKEVGSLRSWSLDTGGLAPGWWGVTIT